MPETSPRPQPDTVEFDGRCAFALSLGSADKAPYGDSRYTLRLDGHDYVFAGAVPRLLFRLIPGSTRRAHRHWGPRP